MSREKSWKSHDVFKIDRQQRTQKQNTCAAFIYAGVNSLESIKSKTEYKDIEFKSTIEETIKENPGDSDTIKNLKLEIGNKYKEKVEKRLKSALDLFRFDIQSSDSGSGSYGENIGEDIGENSLTKQFQKQYTAPRQYGILINSLNDISDLAKEVAYGNLTIKEYFNIVNCNYIFIVKDKGRNMLYELLSYMKHKNKEILLRDDFKSCLGEEDIDEEGIKSAIEWLSFGDIFLTEWDGKEESEELKFNSKYEIDNIIESCNLNYVGKTQKEIKESDLKTQEGYAKYITTDTRRSISKIKKIKKSMYVKGKYNNLILYGSPGTGKSHSVNTYDGEEFRTVFFGDYEYSDFVGSIMPSIENINGKNIMIYKFQPGLFTNVLKLAINNPEKVYNLVIEELNRAEADNVFGDIFQLLDRKDGFSKYTITNKDIASYIYDESVDYSDIGVDTSKYEILIPSNMNIVCTMNTSDKSVNNLDSAFIRRWRRKYVFIDFKDKELNGKKLVDIIIPGMEDDNISWATFAQEINSIIINSNITNSEDKQLGPYFIKEETLEDAESFANDVLVYLFGDVVRYDPTIIFSDDIKSIGNLIARYKDVGIDVFNENLKSILKKDDVNE